VQNSFFCNKPYINLYEFGSLKSKISSQLLYGEKFKILVRKRKFLKIKTNYDNYIGYAKLSKFTKDFKETDKVSVLKSKILTNPYNFKNQRQKILPFWQ
jgi:hypothetical protein